MLNFKFELLCAVPEEKVGELKGVIDSLEAVLGSNKSFKMHLSYSLPSTIGFNDDKGSNILLDGVSFVKMYNEMFSSNKG